MHLRIAFVCAFVGLALAIGLSLSSPLTTRQGWKVVSHDPFAEDAETRLAARQYFVKLATDTVKSRYPNMVYAASPVPIFLRGDLDNSGDPQFVLGLTVPPDSGFIVHYRYREDVWSMVDIQGGFSWLEKLTLQHDSRRGPLLLVEDIYDEMTGAFFYVKGLHVLKWEAAEKMLKPVWTGVVESVEYSLDPPMAERLVALSEITVNEREIRVAGEKRHEVRSEAGEYVSRTRVAVQESYRWNSGTFSYEK